jgi:bile acid-coenzyme A ligase
LRAILELLKPRLVVGDAAAERAGAVVVSSDDLYDPALSSDPLPERIATYVKAIPSGGSTGRPKVIVDHAPGMLDPDVPSLGMQSGDTVVIPGPLYHAAPFGFGYLALAAGCHLVIMPRFDAAGTLELIERHRGAWLYVVPTMMHRIWALGEQERTRHDLSSLEIVCHIAAACPIWLKEKWIEWLGPDAIWEGYSGTESIAATLIGGREWLEHRGTVGRPPPGTPIRILGENGEPVAPGEVGEIYFLPPGGKGSTYHYLGAEPRANGEWESYGDLGRMDADGYLYLADRRTDLIISGGANIYPAEVEAAIDAWPGVLASVVIGLPHEDLGHRVHAIIEVPEGGTALDLRLVWHRSGGLGRGRPGRRGHDHGGGEQRGSGGITGDRGARHQLRVALGLAHGAPIPIRFQQHQVPVHRVMPACPGVAQRVRAGIGYAGALACAAPGAGDLPAV